jgi:membrane-bound lytic murein transglycosylase D
MRSFNTIFPSFAFAALMPFATVTSPAPSCEHVGDAQPCDHSAVSTAAVEPSPIQAAAGSLVGLVRTIVGELVGAGETPETTDEDELAAQIARVRERIRNAPKLTFTHTESVDEFVKFYTEGRGRRTMRIGLERSTGLRERAEEIFAEEGVPVELVWLAQVESVWRNEANSHVGASGVWQFMPATAERFGLECTDDKDERADFEKSTRAAAKYLRILNKRYDGNWELAIGAYNCGEGNMDKAIERGGSKNFWKLVERDVIPAETEDYVPKVLAASIVARQFASNG